MLLLQLIFWRSSIWILPVWHPTFHIWTQKDKLSLSLSVLTFIHAWLSPGRPIDTKISLEIQLLKYLKKVSFIPITTTESDRVEYFSGVLFQFSPLTIIFFLLLLLPFWKLIPWCPGVLYRKFLIPEFTYHRTKNIGQKVTKFFGGDENFVRRKISPTFFVR